jgi:uncharacterized protein DUF6221
VAGDPEGEYALIELCNFLTDRLDETHASAPAAADRDIKAKRRIVANMRTAIDQAWQDAPHTRTLILHLASRTLRHLAHLYDTHPDYQQEWRLWSE